MRKLRWRVINYLTRSDTKSNLQSINPNPDLPDSKVSLWFKVYSVAWCLRPGGACVTGYTLGLQIQVNSPMWQTYPLHSAMAGSVLSLQCNRKKASFPSDKENNSGARLLVWIPACLLCLWASGWTFLYPVFPPEKQVITINETVYNNKTYLLGLLDSGSWSLI